MELSSTQYEAELRCGPFLCVLEVQKEPSEICCFKKTWDRLASVVDALKDILWWSQVLWVSGFNNELGFENIFEVLGDNVSAANRV